MKFYFTFSPGDSRTVSAPEVEDAHWIMGKACADPFFSWGNIIGYYFLLT